MEKTIKTFELQIDENQNGMVIRLNDEENCVLRISRIPKKLIYSGAEIRNFIDINFTVKNY